MYANWLVVTFAAALLGCASARPGAGADDFDEPISIETSNVPSKTVEDPKVHKETVDVRPVHERYPHAVIFDHWCGGTIISPKWILTAAHCARKLNYVLAGTSTGDSGYVELVKRIIMHPQAISTEKITKWDFMLAELYLPLPLDGKTMAAATLNDQASIPVGLKVAFAGYGRHHSQESKLQDEEVFIQSEDVCNTHEEYEPENMLCAKGGPPRYDSACHRDSGSGLVDDAGRLIGVASWVYGNPSNCSNGGVIYFARVSSVRDWIKNVTNI